jgi:hypothetical protein
LDVSRATVVSRVAPIGIGAMCLSRQVHAGRGSLDQITQTCIFERD